LNSIFKQVFSQVSYCLGFIIVCKRAIVLDEMKSTVFSAVVVSIGYALLGWDFAALLGIFFFALLIVIIH